jgi:hypothetical protein
MRFQTDFIIQHFERNAAEKPFLNLFGREAFCCSFLKLQTRRSSEFYRITFKLLKISFPSPEHCPEKNQ